MTMHAFHKRRLVLAAGMVLRCVAIAAISLIFLPYVCAGVLLWLVSRRDVVGWIAALAALATVLVLRERVGFWQIWFGEGGSLALWISLIVNWAFGNIGISESWRAAERFADARRGTDGNRH